MYVVKVVGNGGILHTTGDVEPQGFKVEELVVYLISQAERDTE
jgi:hypothetical protein